MNSLKNLTKLATGIGLAGGAFAYYYIDGQQKKMVIAGNPSSYPLPAGPKWNFNWDQRHPDAIATKKVLSDGSIEKLKPSATRHIILIRHGNYNVDAKKESDRRLTELGHKQAFGTAQRLQELNLPYTKLITSTMIRAVETGEYVERHFKDLPVERCSLLCEGAPIPPEPPVTHWKAPSHQYFQDGARIEAAFRKHFHRANIEQTDDSYEVIVCHANVIRYFVLRALQFPSEGWLRLSLRHASITWLSLLPNGRVSLRCYGDAGHFPPELLSTS